MKATALLQIIITILFSIVLSKTANAGEMNSISAFSYQLHADSASSDVTAATGCTAGSCGPEVSAAAPVETNQKKDLAERNYVRTASIDHLFILISSPFSPADMILVLFCLMSGLVFMFFGLRGF